MSQEPRVRPLQLVSAEELAELGWKPQRPIWEHSEAVGRTGAGKRPAGDFRVFVDEAAAVLRAEPGYLQGLRSVVEGTAATGHGPEDYAPPPLRLRPQPEPPEAA